jgi:PST family polysaccharide transporter
MILFTTVFSQITTLEIRKFIISSCNINQAGYWEAMQRISSIYMMFFTSLTTIYYLPKLSEILNNSNITTSNSLDYKKLISQFYLYLIPFVLIIFIIIFLLKNEIVLLVLNSNFTQVTHLFQYQLIGDFFKIASSILALQFFIRKDTKIYLVLESISLIIYLFSAYYFIEIQQEVGATIGFAISNFVYFVLVVLVRLRDLPYE